MTDVPPEVTPRVSGQLPLGETASADRIGRVAPGDLPAASPLDAAGMVLVTSCVTTRFGLADLVAEAAAVGLVNPVRVTFRSPYAALDGKTVSEAALLSEAELSAFRRFADGSAFKFADGAMRAFLHAVVVARPGEPTVGVPEELWVTARTAWLSGVLSGEISNDPPARPFPAPVVLWTVGLESPTGRGVRLRSGLRAALDRSVLQVPLV